MARDREESSLESRRLCHHETIAKNAIRTRSLKAPWVEVKHDSRSEM
jgi:hypothetical protein